MGHSVLSHHRPETPQAQPRASAGSEPRSSPAAEPGPTLTLRLRGIIWNIQKSHVAAFPATHVLSYLPAVSTSKPFIPSFFVQVRIFNVIEKNTTILL